MEPAPDLHAHRQDGATWRSWVLPVVMVVLLLGVGATSAVLLLDRSQQRAAPAVEPLVPADVGAHGAVGHGPAAAAVDLARAVARTYFSLDHRDVRAGVDAMRPMATAGFESRYAARIAGLRPRVERLGVDLSAALPADGSATEYLTGKASQVLVTVDVTTTSRRPASAMQVTARVSLVRTGTRWLVSDLQQVG